MSSFEDGEEFGEKRSLEDNVANISKKLKANNDDNCINHSVFEDGGTVLEDTQEYSLVNSEGFDCADEEGKLEITQNYTPEQQSHEDQDNVDNFQEDSSGTKENSQGFSPSLQDGVQEEMAGENGEVNGKFTMTKIVSVQKDAELISTIIPGIQVEQVYEKVLENRGNPNRVDIVTDQIIEGGILSHNKEHRQIPNAHDIFKDISEVLVAHPMADPNEVYSMLEAREKEPDRVKSVVSLLSEQVCSTKLSQKLDEKVAKPADKNDLFNDNAFKSNPLYKDVKTLHKVLPDRDPNEIYAYLEAHFDKLNRVQIVLEELTKSDSQESFPVQARESHENQGDKGKAPMTNQDKIQIEIDELKQIFPDCDPNFLYEKLEQNSGNPDRVGKIAAELFESKKYPKISEVIEQEKRNALKKKFERLVFNMKDFMKKFPNALEYFADESRQVSTNYKNHVLVFLKNQYPIVKDGFITKVLEDHQYHLAPTVTAIDETLTDIGGRKSKKTRRTPRHTELEYPESPDELFFHEVMFCQHQRQIRDYVEEQEQTKAAKREAARMHGELMECGCCFDDECLFEDMQACGDGHLFCKECIFRSCEAAIGQGKVDFVCLTGTCEHQFPLPVLQEILPPNVLSIAIRKLQEEEIRRADIPDLVSCPFCSFATIMPDSEDKVFKCLNNECLKESCRLCKEPNHVPLHCDEVEKQGETSMRSYIETKMSEAMLRKCPNCKKRFYKVSGCNKMTCNCGTSMCYVCRTANIDYSHFDNGGCPIDSDIMGLHKEEMLKAAEDARQEYLRDHPDAADTEMKYDPIKLLEKMKNQMEDDDYDEDDSDDQYDD